MAASYTWPGDLPQTPLQNGYRDSRGVLVKRTPMGKGAAKMRYVGKRSNPFTVVYLLDEDGLDLLEEFLFVTRGGVARFNFPHPHKAETIEVNVVPSDDGEQYSKEPVGGGFFRVTINLEELP